MKTRSLTRSLSLLLLCFSGLAGTPAFAQEEQGQEREERRALRAADFTREELSEEYRRMAREKRHQEMDFAKELLASGRMQGETKAEMMLRLADLYFEEGRDLYLSEMLEYEGLFDACFNNPQCSTETMVPDNEASHRWQEKSIQLYRQILRNYPTFERADEATFYLASALQEIGERQEGVEEFTRLAKTYPDSDFVPDAYVQIGEYYFDNNNAYKALLAYQKASAYRNSPKYAFAMYKLAWCYYNVGEYGRSIDTMKAVVAYSMAAAEGSGDGNQTNITLQDEALKDLVRFFADAGEMDEAYTYFNRLGKKELIRSMLKRLAATYFEQGKFEETIQTYRRLIAEDPNSADAPDYQNEIILAYTKMGRKRETVAEIGKLLETYGPNTDWARQNAADPEAVQAAVDFIEKNLRTAATNYHEEARRLRTGRSAEEAFTLAERAYQVYLQEFPDSRYTYDMRYAFGELLYKVEKFSEAYDEYMAVVAMGTDGQHSRFCAESSIFAAEELVEEVGSSSAASGSIEAVELNSAEQKLLAALDQYATLYPTDDKTPDIIYKSAYLLHDLNHLEEAATRFRTVIERDPGARRAEYAAHKILDGFTLREDWGNLLENARFFRDQEALGSNRFKGEVANIYMRTSFKLVQVNYEEQEDFPGAADGFWAFYEEFPDSEVADKALNNSAFYYAQIGNTTRAIACREALIENFEDSEFYNEQVSLLGYDMENMARFGESADLYEELFELDDEHEAAPAAIYSAAQFRYALGDWQQAIENYKEYMATYPDRENSAQIPLTIARIYEENDQWREAGRVYYAFFNQRDTSELEPDQLMFARLHYAVALREQGQQNAYLRSFQENMDWYTEALEDGAVFEIGKDFAGQMMYTLLDDQYNEFLALEISGPSGRVSRRQEDRIVKDQFDAKQSGRAEIEQAYIGVIETGAGEWSIASLVQLGKVYENMASSLRNSHVPSYLENERQIDFYKAAMNDNALQLLDRALTYYNQALAKAYEIGLYNEFTAFANERRSEILPSDYPPLVEDLLDPGYSSTAKTTASFVTEY